MHVHDSRSKEVTALEQTTQREEFRDSDCSGGRQYLMEVTIYSPLFYLTDKERSRPHSPDTADDGSMCIDR